MIGDLYKSTNYIINNNNNRSNNNNIINVFHYPSYQNEYIKSSLISDYHIDR